MRRRASGPLRSGAIVGVALLALAVEAPRAGADPAEATEAAKRKPKPKPVTCRATQVTIVLKGRTRCRAARPGSAAKATPLAVARAVLGANTGTLRAGGGRRIRPIWKSAPGLGRVRTRLLRALPKVVALVERRARASARVPGDPPACASDPRGPQRTSSDGFTVGIAANGDVTMSVGASGGYRVEAFLGGLQDCADLDLPECPAPDGRLDGTDGRRTELGVKVTRDGALVQSLRTTLRSRQTLHGTVADDAKLDDLDLTDVANDTLTFQIPGRTVSVRVALRGSARLSFRSGAISGARVETNVAFSGTTAADALSAAGRSIDEYVQRFPDLVRREGAHLTRREQLWQSPGRCARVMFEPPSDTRRLARDATGQVSARIETRDGGGVAAKGKWTLSAPQNATFTPETADGGAAAFGYTVTRAGEGVKVSAAFRATSTAGVAEGTWAQPTSPTINRIEGTFTLRQEYFGAVLEWAGNATFERATPVFTSGSTGDFKVTGGLYTATASGADRFVVGSTCSQRGSKQFALSKETHFTVLSTGADPYAGPYDYTFSLSSEGQSVSGIPMLDITLYGCGPNAAQLEGQVFSHPVSFGMTTPTQRRSEDGVVFAGSETSSYPNGTFTQTWSFRGSE